MYKNQLQEYYQQRNLSLPVYSTKLFSGSVIDNLFISTVELSCGSTFEGHQKRTKKEAEQSAAEKALNHINNNRSSDASLLEIIKNLTPDQQKDVIRYINFIKYKC